MTNYSFEIPGVAAPQGSKKFVGTSKKTGRAILVEQSTKVKPWRTLVTAFLRQNPPGPQLGGAIAIEIRFYFTRPASSAAAFPANAGVGDLDKLTRSTFDALTTSGIWEDDSRVVDLHAHKLYTPFHLTPPHAVVRIWQVQG